MKTVRIREILGLLMMIAIIGCSDDNDDLEPWQLEVDELKAATAKYVNVDVATAEGFFDASGFVPNMGHHYILPERIDETFELSKPEILLYVPNANGVMEIVAVEYAVPIEDLDNPGLPPEGFTGKDDVWEINPNLKQWQLHVWIYTENPEGIFTAHNPAIGEGN
ncbi:hypothetical protein [Muriicola soli]|uniref:hypothetical protein n=1 Tax=Muriicola soli TaxID=2507538 RepID=UPI001FE584F6|nr:hypothetical protein [Muriicola soli]